MIYEHTMPAIFLERPNRFIAYALLNGTRVTCHVKNTGRCKELLLPGTPVILEHHPDALAKGRKTEYSLIQVYKEINQTSTLINMDSQAPNHVAYEWLNQGGLPQVTELKREVRFGDSRIDLFFHQNGIPSFMEVKGVTLEKNGIAQFPDAPTQRGIKHLKELEHAVSSGFQAYALFVIALKGIRHFEPNMETHPAFGEALIHAQNHGVHLLAYDCIVTDQSLSIDQPVPIILPN